MTNELEKQKTTVTMSCELWGRVTTVCMGNVNNRLKCPMRKRVLNPDIKEFFEATCERYRKG